LHTDRVERGALSSSFNRAPVMHLGVTSALGIVDTDDKQPEVSSHLPIGRFRITQNITYKVSLRRCLVADSKMRMVYFCSSKAQASQRLPVEGNAILVWTPTVYSKGHDHRKAAQ
jgi:hypothetical protein